MKIEPESTNIPPVTKKLVEQNFSNHFENETTEKMPLFSDYIFTLPNTYSPSLLGRVTKS